MDELGFDFALAQSWFSQKQQQPYVLVNLTASNAAALAEQMSVAVRRCYITDQKLTARALTGGCSQLDVLSAVLPDRGATMAGDFGEILCYFYQSAKELPSVTVAPKKWRLKQDRTKPAPKSDVIHFVMPNRPEASAQDAILCAEVKLKSTTGTSTPIASAIEDCEKDRTSRLASTLVWLRERAIGEDLGDVDIPLLNRFTNLIDHPPAVKRFRAVAVICESLHVDELVAAPDSANSDFTLVVIVVPDLKTTYEAVFSAALSALPV